MVDDVVAVGLVVAGRQVMLRQRQAHGVAESLPQWPSGHLDARSPLGVAGRDRSPLPEVAQLVHVHPVEAAQVEQRVLKHRSVAGRQHEPVAVEEVGVLGVVLHHFVPKDVCHRGAAHRQARVARVGPLARIDGEEADGVDAFLLQRFVDCGGAVALNHVGRCLRLHVRPAPRLIRPIRAMSGALRCKARDRSSSSSLCGSRRLIAGRPERHIGSINGLLSLFIRRTSITSI
eukprot:scaffold45850_cov42-Prasinocladus_malaysianus.AAC.1